MPKLNDIQVNSTEYESGIVIEQYRYWQGAEPQWAVPAWDECGCPDLAGPFASVFEAEQAIKRELGE